MKRKNPTALTSGPGRVTMAVIGAGNLGRVLALTLKGAGYRVTEIGTRPASRAKATALARRVGARAVELTRAVAFSADVVWLCVPDDAIATVARDLAKTATTWRGKTVLHTSGALNSKELAPLKRKGAVVGSAHPMNSFVKTSKPDLRDVPFAVEGDAPAVATASSIARRLGGEVFRIQPQAKVLYHAMGAFTSPLLVSTLYAGERVGQAAGIREPRKVMKRILRETIGNFLRDGSSGAFSGPIRRGDVKTVKRHLSALRKVQGTEAIYRVLAIQAVHGLPGKEKKALMKLLTEGLRI